MRRMCCVISTYFFFQAEDGIRDVAVTGVQTCALPILQIEQCFRDWKSHLGLRGLHLQVQKSERLLRVLMGFTLAYLTVLLLGTDPFAEKLRPYFEQQRRKPRHGTCKVLSVLSIALQVLSDARWRQPAYSSGVSLATEPARSLAYYPSLCRCSPMRVGGNRHENG